MPLCSNCTQPCNCLITEDGFFGAHIEFGRNQTQVEGDGSPEDPYVIHFLDSKEFRPKTAEGQFNNQLIGHNAFGEVVSGDGSVPTGSVIYQSPHDFIIPDLTAGYPRYAQGNFWYIGGTVTFAEAGPINTIRHLFLAVAKGTSFPFPNTSIGAQSAPGGPGDPLTLSVEGYTSGVFSVVAGLGSIIQEINLFVYQDSGGAINITDARIWMTQI